MGVVREKFRLEALDDGLERLMVFAGTFLDAHDDVAVHLEESAVAVVGEALVFAALGKAADGAVVEAEVEDGVHHPGHGVASPGADGHEEGIGDVPEFASHGVLELGDGFVNLAVQGGGVGAVVVVVIGADFRGDGEAGRHGQADLGHFGEVGPLAPEEGLHLPVAVGLAVAEEVDVFDSLGGTGFLGFGGFGFCGHIKNKRFGMPAKGFFGKPVQVGLVGSGAAAGRLFQADSWNDKTL